MNFRDLKIGQKIASGFFLVSAIALIIGITGITSTYRMGSSFERVANVEMTSIYYLGEMDIAIEKIFENYVQLSSPHLNQNQREELLMQVEAERDLLEEYMNHFESLDKNEEEKKAYEEVKNTISNWKKVNLRIGNINARFTSLGINDPTALIAQMRWLIQKNYELRNQAQSAIHTGIPFEGGTEPDKSAFAQWAAEFQTDNAIINAELRNIRPYHRQFHQSLKTIKDLIHQRNTDNAQRIYEEQLITHSQEMLRIFETIIEEATQAQEALQNMIALTYGESAQYHKVFNEKFAYLKKQNTEDARLESAAGEQTLLRSSILIVLSVLIGLSVATFLGIWITRNITKGISQGVRFAEKVAKGELSIDVENKLLKQNDEIGQLAKALQQMVMKLKEIIGNVINSADNISGASQEMSSGSQQLSQGASEQASSAEEISSSMEQMVSNIQQNTDNARQTEKIAMQAAKSIGKVSENSSSSTRAIKEIASKITIIGDIAYKTNILALNAAVEAARAGEHGHGFAVVADEVRNLAEQSQKAADEIDLLSVNSVELADEAEKQLISIAPEIEKTSKLVQEIVASSMEQNAGAEQVNNAIQQLSQVIQQNAAASEEMASSSEELSSQSEQMKSAINYFSIHEIAGESHTPPAANHPQSSLSHKSTTPQNPEPSPSPKGIQLNLTETHLNDNEFERF